MRLLLISVIHTSHRPVLDLFPSLLDRSHVCMCLRKAASVHICWSLREDANEGMPVRRMPCLIFQNETPSGSSSTPSCAPFQGAFDQRPFAIGEGDAPCFPEPWQTAQFSAKR